MTTPLTTIQSMSRVALESAFTQREKQLEHCQGSLYEARAQVASLIQSDAGKLLAQLEDAIKQRDLALDKLTKLKKDPEPNIGRLMVENVNLKAQVSKLEAAACEMREALEDEREMIIRGGRHHVEERRMGVIKSALSTDAGQSLLDRLTKAEAGLAKWKSRFDYETEFYDKADEHLERLKVKYAEAIKPAVFFLEDYLRHKTHPGVSRIVSDLRECL